jgi:hypothetical protein
MKKKRKFWHVLIFIAVLAAAIAIIMLLWNALIPSIIGWSAINYWQAAGLAILCKLLFGGFGRFGHGFRHHHGHGHGHKQARHLHERMKGMSREEKRDFIRKRMAVGFDRMFDDENEVTSDKTEE